MIIRNKWRLLNFYLLPISQCFSKNSSVFQIISKTTTLNIFFHNIFYSAVVHKMSHSFIHYTYNYNIL
jgi:hypothetical protein